MKKLKLYEKLEFLALGSVLGGKMMPSYPQDASKNPPRCLQGPFWELKWSQDTPKMPPRSLQDASRSDFSWILDDNDCSGYHFRPIFDKNMTQKDLWSKIWKYTENQKLFLAPFWDSKTIFDLFITYITYTHTYIHTCMHTYTTYIPYIHTYITYIHYIHTYIHT